MPYPRATTPSTFARYFLGALVAPKEFFSGSPQPTSRADPRYVTRFIDWLKDEIRR